MTQHSSPTGASTTKGRTVPYDREKHPPDLYRITWEPTPDHEFGAPFRRVIELEPTTSTTPTFTPEELEQVPSFLREGLEAEASTPSPKNDGKVPRKFEYLEALRGRIGKGPTSLTLPEYATLVTLYSYADSDLTNARPGHARLASDLSYSGPNATRTTRRLTSSLEKKGYLVVTKKGTSIGGNAATTYRLTLPKRS